MELRHLRYFVCVAEEEHFGRAAERLQIVQPALSRQIQDLEEEMGFTLFDRLPRGVRLNAAGKQFLADVRRVLQDVDEAKVRAERIAHGKSGTLRIGIATAMPWHGLVAQSLREFRRKSPDAELELHHMLSVRQVEAVLSGRLDAGFVAGLLPLEKELDHWEFTQDRMVLAVPKGHPLKKRKEVRLRDLRDMPFVWFPRWVNPIFYDRLMQACIRGGLTPQIVQEAPDRDTNLGLVQCHIGIAWHNESVRWHCPRGISVVTVADMDVRMPFDLVWKKDNTSPLLQRFLAQVMSR